MNETLGIQVAVRLLASCLMVAACGHWANAQDAMRQWSDASGKFKVLASLQRTEGEYVYLQTNDGRPLRIPIARLSAADQTFLQENDNPFEELPDDGMSAAAAPASSTAPAATIGSPASSTSSSQSLATVWSLPLNIDWDGAAQLQEPASDVWQLQVAAQTLPKSDGQRRAALGKKPSPHEKLAGFAVHPRSNRAAVSFSQSAFVPEPVSRLTLVDLASAKALPSVHVAGQFAPLCLLNDGSTVLMHGCGIGGRAINTSDQLQLWRLVGDQVERSDTWVPFPATSERFGKPHHAAVEQAIALDRNRIVLRSNEGHLACVDTVSRQPLWAIEIDKLGGFDALPDQSLLAVIAGNRLLVIDPHQGQIQAALTLGDEPNNHVRQVAWSPDGSQIAAAVNSELWIIDSRNGSILQNFTLPDGAHAVGGLSFPDPDYLFLSGTLFHLPSQLLACHYMGADLRFSGGVTYIAIDGLEQGLVTAATIPHPSAAKLLAENANDADKFLIQPGVKVALDVSATGSHAAEITQRLTAAIQTAGYELVPQSEITIVAEIGPPVLHNVNYIAGGSHTTSVTKSHLKIRWQGRDVWNRTVSNEPESLRLENRETIEQRLAEIAKHPNLTVFDENAGLPKRLQRPLPADGGPKGKALMTSQFTPKGLVDLK